MAERKILILPFGHHRQTVTKKTMAANTSNFRLDSKNLFLTFPQCDYPLEDFCQKVKDFFTEKNNRIIKGVASQENHQDGNKHLHLYINLEKPCQTRNVAYFDNLVCPPKHPNIVSRLKSLAKTIKYIIKDGNYKVLPSENSFDLDVFLEQSSKKKSTKSSLIVKMISEGAKLDEIDDEHPEYVMNHKKSLQEYLDYRVLKSLRQSRALAQQAVFRVSPASGHMNSFNQDLASWLNQNIRTTTPRPHRTAQLWLRASPATGKSSLIKYLEEEFTLSTYHWPKDEKWWDAYEDGCYDLIVLDEYKAHKKITELNPILSGDITPLSRRGTSPIIKRDNLPVIILSNFLPQECYHKATPYQLSPLLSRLTVIDFGDNLIRIVRSEDNNSVSTDTELEEIMANVSEPDDESLPPYPVFLPPQSPPSPSTPPVASPQYLSLEEELDPNSSFFFSNQYNREVTQRAKRVRAEQFIEPVQTIRLSRAMRSIQPKKHKRPRNNRSITDLLELTAECSDESESDDDSYHTSDYDFLDDSLSPLPLLPRHLILSSDSESEEDSQ